MREQELSDAAANLRELSRIDLSFTHTLLSPHSCFLTLPLYGFAALRDPRGARTIS